MTRVLTLVLGILLLGQPARAQEPAEASRAQQPATATPQPERREPGVARPAPDVGQAVNIRVDATITDQQTTGQPVLKTITMVVADNWQSRLRTEGNVFTTGGQYQVSLNVDARPRLMGDKILLMMTVEYKPTAPEPKPGASTTTLNQAFQVVLADGKPLVVSQSADPNSDRKVKLEVKATVIR